MFYTEYNIENPDKKELLDITTTEDIELIKCFQNIACSFSKELEYSTAPRYDFNNRINEGKNFVL